MANDIVLEVKDLSISFKGLKAVDSLNLQIHKNEIYGLIGPNGAGKTTAFNIITGVYKPTAGNVYLNGEDISGLSQMIINRKGIARTFQNIRLFANMSVIQNVTVAMNNLPDYKYNALQAFLRTPSYYSKEEAMRANAKSILDVFGLLDERNELAANLPYGKQRKLEIARALATDPSLLLLDEPAAGMNPEETQNLMDTIRLVRDKFDMTILLIEHDMRLVTGICDNVTVLNFGQTLASGETKEVLNKPEVIKAYLGGDDDEEAI